MSPSWPRLTVPPSLLNTIIHSGAEEGFPEKTIAWMGKLWEIGWHSSIKQLSCFYLHLITLAWQLIRSPCFSLFFPSQACDLQLLKNMHLSFIGHHSHVWFSILEITELLLQRWSCRSLALLLSQCYNRGFLPQLGHIPLFVPNFVSYFCNSWAAIIVFGSNACQLMGYVDREQ